MSDIFYLIIPLNNEKEIDWILIEKIWEEAPKLTGEIPMVSENERKKKKEKMKNKTGKVSFYLFSFSSLRFFHAFFSMLFFLVSLSYFCSFPLFSFRFPVLFVIFSSHLFYSSFQFFLVFLLTTIQGPWVKIFSLGIKRKNNSSGLYGKTKILLCK